MEIKFVNKNNLDIDEFVKIVWESHASHEKEYFRIRQRDEIEKLGLINDEKSEDEEIIKEVENKPKKLDLSYLKRLSAEKKENEDKKTNRLLIAIDSGIANLGDFSNGTTAFAIRGAAVCYLEKEIIVLRYNTGAVIIDDTNKTPIFRYIGSKFGNEELYVQKDENGDFIPRSSAFETTNQLQDRCRNFVERMIQLDALKLLNANGGGTLLLDGALPAGTFDTPEEFLKEFLNFAVNKKIDTIAVSKKTTLTVSGKRIQDIFDDNPAFIGFIPLLKIINKEREHLVENNQARKTITLGNELFGVRFGLGPPSLTFRVDIKNSISSTQEDAIRKIFNECPIQSCYPKPLVEAHQFSSFFYQDIQTLIAEIVARTGVIPKEDSSMGWIFQPFGAFGK